MDMHGVFSHKISWRHLALAGGVIAVGVGVALAGCWAMHAFIPGLQKVTIDSSPDKPTLTTEVVVSGYTNIWDVAFLPNKDMLFTERKGIVHIGRSNGEVGELAKIPDIYARGEG